MMTVLTVLLWVLFWGFIAAVVGAIITLVSPARISLGIEGDNRLDALSVSFRFVWGLFGPGARVHRGTRFSPVDPVLVVGIRILRWLIPIRSFRLPPEQGAEAEREQPAEPDRGEKALQKTPSPEARSAEPERPRPVAEKRVKPPAPKEAAAPPPAAEEEPAEEPEPKRGFLGIDFDELRAVWDEWWPVAREFLRRIWGFLHVHRVVIRGELGLDDPATTGQALAFVAGLHGFGGRALRTQVRGNFDEVTISGLVEAEWQMSMVKTWSAFSYLGWILFKRWRRQRREEQREE